MTETTRLILGVSAILERLGIRYHVGGSFASSAHGRFRTSADIDFVIDPDARQLEVLAAELDPEFYVSRTAIHEALATHGTFNAIHVASSFKIDFFLKGTHAFDEEELRRSISAEMVPGSTASRIKLKSAEDTVLRKLEWFRRGGEISQQQWRDVVEILATATLDEAHLDRWAETLAVTDLLAAARAEARELR